jgi:hypothetical protein
LSWQRDWPAAALLAAALILILPLWRVSVPGMPDYPARLASFWLIGGGVHDPAVARFYHLDWKLVPNLASEILVPLLARLMPLAVATKLFLSVGVLMWAIGGGLLQRALFGRIGIAPLAGALFAYNGNFLWGFFNFYFAAGPVLLIFAAWVAGRERAGPRRLACFALAATLVYFCHVFAAAMLLVLIAGFEAADTGFAIKPLVRKAGIVALIFLPATLIFLFLRPDNSDRTLAFNLADTIEDRFDSLIGLGFDQPAHFLPALLLAGLALAFLTRRARLDRAMALPLAVLFLGALVAPESAMGGWAVHLRLPAFFCTVLFAACEVRPGRWLASAGTLAMLALAGWNQAALARYWQTYDRRYGEFRATLQSLPRGQRLMTAIDGDPYDDVQPYWHLADFAVIDRGDMTSLMFTTKGQHVVQLNPPFVGTAAASARQGSPPMLAELDKLAAGRADGDSDIRDVFPYLMRFPCHYDEVLVVNPAGPGSPAPSFLKLRHRGSFFSLYDIGRDGACGS